MNEAMFTEMVQLLVQECGTSYHVDTSAWQVRSLGGVGCSISGIDSQEHMAKLREWLRDRKQLTTNVLGPTAASSDWTVIAAV